MKTVHFFRHPVASRRIYRPTSHFSYLIIFFFCFLPMSTWAQDISESIFGDYEGEARVQHHTLFEFDESMDSVIVSFLNTGAENDYILTIGGFDLFDIKIGMDSVIVTPFGDGYKLSRLKPITFIIPEITIPPIPSFPEGATFTDVPVNISLENTTIIDSTLDLNIKIVVTLTVYVMGFPVPLPIPFEISFKGELMTPPPLPDPPVIITDELENGTVNEEYFATLEAESELPITWTIIDGLLPIGLELDSVSGIISGIPTEANIFSFTIQAATDAGTDTKVLSIEIEDEEVIDTVGITTINNFEFRIYPNPTTGELRIETCDMRYEICDMRYEICDVYGRNVSNLKSQISNHQEWQPQADGVVLNISNLTPGIYFLKIQTNNGVVVKKIIKILI
jgi:hypothetical protein